MNANALMSRSMWLLLLFVAFRNSHAQPAATPSPPNSQLPPNRVLDLGRPGSYVQLPANLFTNLTQATVEAWVKIGRMKENSHFLDFGGYQREMYLGTDGTDPALKYLVIDHKRDRHRIVV